MEWDGWEERVVGGWAFWWFVEWWYFNCIKLVVMGSFRSQPDLVKHSVSKSGLGTLTYAVSHMCGKLSPTQDGESTWRTHISTNHLSATPKIHFSECLTATEVIPSTPRPWSVHLRRTPLPQRTLGQQKLPSCQIRVGTQGDLHEDGRAAGLWRRPQGDHQHSEGNDG